MGKLAGLISIASLLLLVSCAKEYSYEGGDMNGGGSDTILPPVVVNEFPACPVCTTITTTELSKWSFKTGNSVLCGTADTAIITLERNAFTFFGPSSCSEDTGMVITVYLENVRLDKDITNLTTNRVAFYYYDGVTPSYIFMSQTNTPFSATIDNYNHQTRIASGTFQGNVIRTSGGAASITSGKYKVRLL